MSAPVAVSESNGSTDTLENLLLPASDASNAGSSEPGRAEDEAAPIIALAAQQQQQQQQQQEQAAIDEATGSQSSVKQDYRLDFTEVEGTLEEIPEDATVALAPLQQQQQQQQQQQAAAAEAPAAAGPSCDLVSSPYASFHIPESNASDIAASEFSDTASSYLAASGFPFIRAEPLTAKQQVALWLTRTSMSDMSSMPSLRSLVFPKSSSGYGSLSGAAKHNHPHLHHMHHLHQQDQIHGSFRPSCTSTGEKKPRRSGRAEIRRNFSTKSLLNGVGFSSGASSPFGSSRDQDMTPTPIRKCETVIALSKTPSSSGLNNSVSGPGQGTSSRSRRSSLNLFKRLAQRGSSSASSASKTTTKALATGQSQQQQQQQQQQAVAGGSHLGVSGFRTPGRGGGFSMTSEMSGCESPFGRGIRPVNRLRSSSSMVCSHCASAAVSFNNSRMTSRATSQISLLMRRSSSTMPPAEYASSVATTANNAHGAAAAVGAAHHGQQQQQQQHQQQAHQLDVSFCKICLEDLPEEAMAKLAECGCNFCKECMESYISLEVSECAYDIACPDPLCERQGILQIPEMEQIVGKEVMDRHRANRLNREVALDSSRAWCPRPDCETICHVCEGDNLQGKDKDTPASAKCPSCAKEFCARCSANWHPGETCAQYGQKLVAQSLKSGGNSVHSGFFTSGGGEQILNLDKLEGDIKPCPMCHVPIERDAGCAQMMCKRCKHVFCWYCQTSLDDDFLLRHYDNGACKGRLGHSRVSVLWHRAQVIGIFAGFGILLLVASPLLLLAAPCILCCRCKILERLETESSKRSQAAADAATASEASNNDPEEAMSLK